jgi:hypothetical protein
LIAKAQLFKHPLLPSCSSAARLEREEDESMGKIRPAVTTVVNVLALFVVAFPAATPVLAQHQSERSFQLQKGQAIRITPDGKVDVFATMQGDQAHVEKMDKRAKPVTKGLGMWFGPDGKLRYVDDTVEGAEGFQHKK